MDSLNPNHLDPADPHNLQGTDEPVLERIGWQQKAKIATNACANCASL